MKDTAPRFITVNSSSVASSSNQLTHNLIESLRWVCHSVDRNWYSIGAIAFGNKLIVFGGAKISPS